MITLIICLAVTILVLFGYWAYPHIKMLIIGYDDVCYETKDYKIVENSEGFCGVISGWKTVIPIDYRTISPYKDAFVGFKNKRDYLFDKNGVLLIEYRKIEPIADGSFKVFNRGRYGIYNIYLKDFYIPLKYTTMEIIADEVAVVKGGNPILMNLQGSILFGDTNCTSISFFGGANAKKKYLRILMRSRQAVLDIEGKYVMLPGDYQFDSVWADDLFLARLGYKKGLISPQGVVVPFEYKEIYLQRLNPLLVYVHTFDGERYFRDENGRCEV